MFKILSRRSPLSIYGEIANRHTGVCFILCFVAPGKIFRVRGTSPKFLMQLRIDGKKFRLDTLGHEAKLECSDNCVLSKEISADEIICLPFNPDGLTAQRNLCYAAFTFLNLVDFFLCCAIGSKRNGAGVVL